MGAWNDAKTAEQRNELLRSALKPTSGNVTRAAQMLGLSRRHLTRRLGEMRGLTEQSQAQVSTAVQATEGADVTVTLALRKSVKDWLERKALERKQRDGGRFAVSPIVEELVEREMAREGEEK